MVQTVINVHLGGKGAFALLIWQSGCRMGRLLNVQAKSEMADSFFQPIFLYDPSKRVAFV